MMRTVGALVAIACVLAPGMASAYMCEGLFAAAEQRIREAEAAVTADTDVRIKQKLAEAKGLLKSAKIGHRQATERHTGAVGKYSHGDAVRQARWSEALATEVIFPQHRRRSLTRIHRSRRTRDRVAKDSPTRNHGVTTGGDTPVATHSNASKESDAMRTPDASRRPLRARVSRRTFMRTAAVGGGLLAVGKLSIGRALAAGPNNSGPAYVLPSTNGVTITPLLTVGDAADNGYRMVGVPDGLGAFDNGQTFTLLMNHELRATQGIARAHGSPGAFVSKWTIDRQSLRVVAGEDLTPSANDVHLWDVAQMQYVSGTTAWDRLCSADLPDEKALRHGNRGTKERIFLDGEETSTGRPWARIVTGPNAGQAWQLPRLGRMAYENVVACPHGKDRTIVAMFDDGSLNTAPVAANNPSEVYIYVGTKQTSGSEIERAGLTNGKLYGVRVFRDDALVTEESNDFGLGNGVTGYVGSGRFDLVELGTAGDVRALSPLQLEQDAIARNVFRMQRPEDGAWDPRGNGNDALYFVTTASISPLLNSRLWRLTFDDLDRPEAGGRIEILLTNTPARMFDNITIDRLGRVLLQEDTGNNPWVSKIWVYGIDNGSLTEVAHHDPAFFEPGGASFITQDEESSGIIDAHDIFGEGWFLFVVQIHKTSADAELVEGGQLSTMYVHPGLGR